MLHSRRQGHASFASVVEAGAFSTPEGASVAGPRRPASVPPGAAQKPCWTLQPDQSRSFEPLSPLSVSWLPVRLAPFLPPDVSALLSQPFRIRPIGASPNRLPLVTRRFPPSSGPCKSLALLWFPSAPPPPYSYETVTESPWWKARNGRFGLLITWITGTSRAIQRPGGFHPGGASSNPANSNPGTTTQLTSAQPAPDPFGRASVDCQRLAGTRHWGS